MQGKNRFFSKKVEIPVRCSLTAVKAAYAAKKASFISTKPSHQESGIERPAPLFEFFIFIFQRNLRNQRLKKYLLR
jgi:hypothetical protein